MPKTKETIIWIKIWKKLKYKQKKVHSLTCPHTWWRCPWVASSAWSASCSWVQWAFPLQGGPSSWVWGHHHSPCRLASSSSLWTHVWSWWQRLPPHHLPLPEGWRGKVALHSSILVYLQCPAPPTRTSSKGVAWKEHFQLYLLQILLQCTSLGCQLFQCNALTLSIDPP